MNRPRGQVTVLYHSLVWPYLDVSQRMAIESSFAQASEIVTPDTPLAWLKMDHDHIRSFSHLSYHLWTGENGPGGEQVFIGPCHPHGAEALGIPHLLQQKETGNLPATAEEEEVHLIRLMKVVVVVVVHHLFPIQMLTVV